MGCSLEDILQKGVSSGIFTHIRSICSEHQDITVKYALAMLHINPGREVEINHTFKKRFKIAAGEWEDVLSRADNWLDYRVYTLFSFHAQQILGLGEEEFLRAATNVCFTNYQDKQLALARLVPIKVVLNGMSSQFDNWARVTEVKVDRYDRMRDYIRITRKTKPEFAESLIRLVGEENAACCFQRDCNFTQYAFATTFQELYAQKDLLVERVSQEGVDDHSEYLVKPSKPYQSGVLRVGRRVLDSVLWMFAPWYKGFLAHRELEDARVQLANRDSDVRERTANLSEANALLDNSRIELQDRQDQIVDLMARINEMKAQGERHGIYNSVQSILDPERERILRFISDNLLSVYTILSASEQLELVTLTEPFGITETMLRNRDEFAVLRMLHDIELSKLQRKSLEVDLSPVLTEDPFELLMGAGVNPFSNVVFFDSAYERFQSLRESVSSPVLHQYDPFALLFVPRAFGVLHVSLKDHLSKLVTTSFEEKVSIEDAFGHAFEAACVDKGVSLHVEYHCDYKAQLVSNAEIVTNLLRDVIYDAIDYGKARNIRFYVTQDFSQIPHYPTKSFFHAPSFYFSIENDGIPIDLTIAQKLNGVLDGSLQLTDDISSRSLSERKTDRAIGTRGKLNFQRLHGAHYFVEPIVNQLGEVIRYATKWSVYVEKLKA